jgi:proteasome lid subunit RPN8/RPN11
MLQIQQAAMEAVRRHAEEGYPLEICGFLVGAAEGEGRRVREAWPVRNAWEDDPEQRAGMLAAMEKGGGSAGAERWEQFSAERRFLVSPRDILASMKRAREAGLDLVGLYHTHPEHPAVPSDFDRDAAWPDWSYLILSVREGRVAEERSWVLAEEERRFMEEEVREEP